VTSAETPLEKFQTLLRKLFQVQDAAELDFGIYRILNLKRTQVEEFIASRLPAIVDEAFREFTGADTAGLQSRLDALRTEIADVATGAAFDEDGELVTGLRGSPKGKEYVELRSQLAAAIVTEEQKTRVYNDLYSFFSRYYDDGDFITTRRIRYAGNEAYAIPYSGEEVVLHWATKDQYYVKTTEQLKNYRFHVRDYSVSFEVVEAAPQEGNNREKNRRFVISGENPVEWVAEKKSLKVRFEYRALTAKEQNEHGKNENQRPQDSLNQKATETVLTAVPDATLKALLATPEGDSDKSLLLRHLNRFTRKNTSDYFIHKNLRAFLERELDYFIKSECVLLEELVNVENPKLPQAHLMRARVVRRIAGHIIDFLTQVEEFQKKLFEKRKFVLRTEYCITLNQVPEAFWPEILANDAQLAEWRDLFALDDLLKAVKKRKPDTTFLKLHPTLVVDTSHFSDDFKWRLMASLDDLDELTDGLLIHGENLQALNLLVEKYRERVACVHIDPPYNTQTSGFLYKNTYQHSSWLAMMADRLLASKVLLSQEASLLCHVDENEYERLKLCLDHTGMPDAGTVVWDKTNPMLGRVGVATQHEYVLWRSRSEAPVYLRPANVRLILSKAQALVKKYGGVTTEARREFAQWVAAQDGLSGGERQYRFIDDGGAVFRGVAMGAPEPRADAKFHIPLIHPRTKKPCPVPDFGWSRTPETLRKLEERGEILYGDDETVMPGKKVTLTQASRRQMSSVIRDAGRGKDDLDRMGMEFPYCHPVSLYVELQGAAAQDDGDVVLDHFAGSGTSGHAVVNLNREDGSRRRFVQVEIGDQFDTVLLPRLKRVTFTPEWNDGKPMRLATAEEAERSPRIIKYHTIEGYEDALENITIPATETAQAALELYGDDYLLKYMLDLETRGSASLLNVEMFKDPFDYKLKVQGENGRQETTVDLIETFNYLLGLDVRKLRQFEDNGRTYRAVLGDKKGKSVVVVWRSVKDIEGNKEALMRDREFVEKTVLPALMGLGTQSELSDNSVMSLRPDRLLVNGASFVKDAEAIEPEFKRLMFAPLSY